MTQNKNPNLLKWGIKYSLSAAVTGMLCCVAPAVLFMFGLMGGVYAISFADFFYNEDGSSGTGAWILKIIAVAIGFYGIYSFRKKQNQCSIDPKRKKKNLIVLIAIIVILGIGLFLSFEKWSAWYFDEYIVPAQQKELNIKN
jgi:cation transport ATPase